MLAPKKLPLTVKNFYDTCVEISLQNFSYDLVNPNNLTKIWIGYSGGLDSRVLLELASRAFKKSHCKLIAVYINHHLSKNSNFWQEHCDATCKELNVDFQAEQLPNEPSYIGSLGNLEEKLRLARIAIWQKLLAAEDILLLAHHLNDQVETIFLRLLRGTGIKGLGGIKSGNSLNGIKIMRPLLNYSRQQILNFAIKHDLKYIEDESNLEKNFSRNYLRHNVLPQLHQRWPNYLQNINNTSKLFQQANSFITSIANNLLIGCYNYVDYWVDNSCTNIVLSIKKLLEQQEFLQFEILRNFIIKRGFEVPSLEKLYIIYQELIGARRDRQPKLNINNYVICRYRDLLYLYAKDYFNQEGLSYMQTMGDLIICNGYYLPNYNLGRAKKIFQKFAIPPWLRKKYPLVFVKNELIAVVGLWIKRV